MALTFADLQTEFLARGFADMTATADTTRIKRWLNDAAHEIDDMNDWPYLNATTTGTAPLTIADLGTIESVTNVAGPYTLAPRDRRDLRREFGDLTTVGTACFYYVTVGTTINVYPVQSGLTLTVDYWKVPTDMSAGGDTPAMPDRYRMAIVDLAVERGSRDRGDEVGAQAARAQGMGRLLQMEQRLMSPQHQQAQSFVGLVGDDC